jgi:hypothetical protein
MINYNDNLVLRKMNLMNSNDIVLKEMSWFAVTCIIVALWKYDRCLLDKLQRWMWSKTSSISWSLFKLWAQYKNKNEMIKDGYHVDSVFLYEHHSPTFARKLDVLRIFRSEIVKETFTNKKHIDIEEFLSLCSDPETNFQYDSKLSYDLEVNYTLDRKQYKIVYSTDCNRNIRFPIYSESEVDNLDSDNSIISASIVRHSGDLNGIEIDDVILKYAGPLGDFYDGTEFVVKKSWLQFSGIENNSKISIMDIGGDSYIFDDDDEYLTLSGEKQE